MVPYLQDILNDQKTNSNNSNEWKIQINMHVNFVSSNDKEKLVLFLCGVIMKKLG